MNVEQNVSLEDIIISHESKAAHLIWFFYRPFGIVLGLTRFMLLVIYLLITFMLTVKGNQVTNNLLLFILGIRISYNMRKDKFRQYIIGNIVAANHVSIYDIFVSLNVRNTATLLYKPEGPLNKFIIDKVIGQMNGTTWNLLSKRELAVHFKEWRKNLSKKAVFVVPEKTVNNGKGLFLFDPEFIGKGFSVIPLVIDISLPFGLHPHATHLSYLGRLQRLFMLPYTSFKVSALSKKNKKENQTREEFAKEVQTEIAEFLKIPSTNYNHLDKKVFVEKKQ